MNRYIEQPAEFAYVVTLIIDGKIRSRDLLFVLRGTLLYQFAKARGIVTERKPRNTILGEIVADVRDKPEAQPIDPNAPVQMPEPKIDPDADICDGCELLQNSDNDIIWEKALRGEPVTISNDWRNAPVIEGQRLDELVTVAGSDKQVIRGDAMVDSVFSMIAAECGIRFKRAEGRGDIHMRFADLSKYKGGTVLGITWVPRNAKTFEAGGDIAGDIVCDSKRAWTMIMLFLKLMHEAGHAIGALDHSQLPEDIMYFQPTAAGQRRYTQADIARFLNLYPLALRERYAEADARLAQAA